MRVEPTANVDAAREVSSERPERRVSSEAASAPTAEELTATREEGPPVDLEQTARPRRRLRENRLDRDLSDLVEDYLEGELDRLNDFVRAFDKRFDFQVHEGAGDYFVQVWDVVEDELIREIPPEDVLDLAARLDEMIGIIFDEHR